MYDLEAWADQIERSIRGAYTADELWPTVKNIVNDSDVTSDPIPELAATEGDGSQTVTESNSIDFTNYGVLIAFLAVIVTMLLIDYYFTHRTNQNMRTRYQRIENRLKAYITENVTNFNRLNRGQIYRKNVSDGRHAYHQGRQRKPATGTTPTTSSGSSSETTLRRVRFDDTTNNNSISDNEFKNQRRTDSSTRNEIPGNKASTENNRRFRQQGVRTSFKSQSRSKSPSFWVNAVAKSVRSVSPFRGADSPSKYQISNEENIQSAGESSLSPRSSPNLHKLINLTVTAPNLRSSQVETSEERRNRKTLGNERKNVVDLVPRISEKMKEKKLSTASTVVNQNGRTTKKWRNLIESHGGPGRIEARLLSRQNKNTLIPFGKTNKWIESNRLGQQDKGI